jgi:tetratricopeptide (TPR) repeat protein
VITQNDTVPILVQLATETVSPATVSATLGDLLLHTGELTRSDTFLRQAIAIKPDDPDANGSLGSLLIRQDKFVEAKPYLQKAIATGNANPLVLFGYAWVTLHEHMTGNAIEELSDDDARNVRSLLQRVIATAPTFSESYRLLALVDFVRDEQLDDAVSLLQKGLAIKRDDAEMQLLLARILLRREDVTRAGQIAEQIASTTLDTKRKAEADEIVKAVYDYNVAKSAATTPVRLNITVGERQGLVVLKRSWLTDDDITQIDRERENNNYNRLIIRPVTGESQFLGRVEKISCNGNSILYRVRTSDSVMNLSSVDFNNVRMTVAREGDNTFQIGCGADLSKQLAVINFRPRSPINVSKTQGELTAISFVANDFRLKSITEMNAARLVAIDDDTLRRSGPRPVVNAETIRHSIEQSLRKPARNEQRIAGTIQSIQCSTTEIDFRVLANGKTYTFAHTVPGRVDMAWFTVASSQLPISCGTGPLASNAIFTYTRDTSFVNVDGELKSVEFVPDGFVP